MNEEKLSLIQNSFVRFLIVGLISTGLNFSLYVLVFLTTNNITLSSIFGYLIGISTSFYFGKIWVFNSGHPFKALEIVRFLTVYFLGGLRMTMIIIWLNQDLNFGYKISWIGGIIFSIINNYLGSKYLVFRTY